MLKAGVSIKEITPREKVLLAGYPEPKGRCAQVAHDPLYCSAYYFENQGQRQILLCNDIISISKDRCNEIRMLIEKYCGISRRNVFISCTHTHSGPVTGGKPWSEFGSLPEQHPENNDFVRDTLLAAAREAASNPFEAQVGFGIGTCGKEKGMGGNRHDPDGPADPSVNVIGIKDQQGALRGCIVNYSMHPTVLHSYNFKVTADFPGAIRDLLNEKYPNMIFGFNMGSSGNQSTRFFRKGQTFAEAQRIGYLIGEEALKVLENLEYTADPVLGTATVEVEPPLKKLPPLEEAVRIAEKAQQELDKLNAEKAPYPVVRSAECTLIGSNYIKVMAESAQKVGYDAVLKVGLPLEATAFRIGNCVLMGVSCENFIEVSMKVKENSPFPYTFMSSLTNGNTAGYVCADYAYDRFCYEAQASNFAKGAAQALADACLEAISKVK